MLCVKVSSAWEKSLFHTHWHIQSEYNNVSVAVRKYVFPSCPFKWAFIFQDMFTHMIFFLTSSASLKVPLSFRDFYSRKKIRLLSCALSSELTLAALLNVCWCQK